jgi:Family of unknown function (DUF6529)
VLEDLVRLSHVPLADVNDVYTDIVTTVFSSTIAAKAWFATAAVILAIVQVVTGARMFGKLGFLGFRGPRVAFVHRWSGRLAFLFTLPVFFHCVTILGFDTPDARVAIHSLAGTFVYGVFVAKVMIVRDRSLPGWALPVAGATMASTLGLLWLTSSLWYFTNVEFGF